MFVASLERPVAWRRRSVAIGVLVAIAGFFGGGGLHTTAALLADAETVPGTFGTAACFPDASPPSVPRSVISKTTQYLAGSIRQGGTYYVYAEATDVGCGLSTVRADASALTTGQTSVTLVAGAYTVGGVAYSYRSASLTANAVISEGSKAYSIRATDNAANVTTQPFNVTVDNTAPTATNVQTANGGTIVGRPEIGDTVTLTFSQATDPDSVLAGWTGSSTSVVIRITNNGAGDQLTVRNAANAVQLPLGTVNLVGTAYVTATRDFGATGTASTMVASGTTIVLTLGTASGATGTQATGGTMVWTPSATATDAAGNACLTTNANESGALDVEF
jgi:hypothetical protein